VDKDFYKVDKGDIPW